MGSAASQLGARAVALATELNKGLGLSYGKTAAVLENAFGLRVSRGGLAQAFARVAKKAEPTYENLMEQIRGSPSVTADETGWKVAGQLWWMWAFSSAAVTVYSIQSGRGFEQAVVVLGAEFDGFLVRDGWIVYRGFSQAIHQTCVAHLLRRCREMMAVARSGAAAFPRTVKGILQAWFATAGSPGSKPDQGARVSDRPRQAGNTTRPGVETCLSFAPESTAGQPLAPRAGRDVHLPVLSRAGGDELPR